MTEWGVVGVIIALAGLGATVVKPLLSLNTSIVKLTTRLEHMTDDLHELTERNSKSHDRLWAKNDAQDRRLDNHELRIVSLEQEHDGEGGERK